MTGLELEWAPLLPALFPLGALVLVLVLDLVTPRLRTVPFAVAALGAAGGAVATVPGLLGSPGDARTTLCVPVDVAGDGALLDIHGLPRTCFWVATSVASTLQLAACLAALLCVALAWPRARARTSEPTRAPIEAVLLLAALAGAVVVAAAADLGTWLIALELATLPVVAWIALSGGRRAVMGSVQLLMTSVVSFALLVLGAGLWLVGTGSPMLTPDAVLGDVPAAGLRAVGAAGDGSTAILAVGVLFMIAGLAFKLSLVPFHAWTPTAYAGASTAVATFLATVSKIAALAALLVVFRAISVVGAPALASIAFLAAVSMTVGNVMALRQRDTVRLLAWSTVAQAGWVVMPLVSPSPMGAKASAAYLLTYAVATAVAFAVVALMVRDHHDGRLLGSYRGLWQRSPWRAGALVLALTSLAGLPPGIIGLVGKVVALRPVLAEGWLWLAVIAAANAVLGVAVYLRWMLPVVTKVPVTEVAEEVTPQERPKVTAVVAGLVVAAVILLAVSIQPDLLLALLG